MGQSDYPICIYCDDSSGKWWISHEGEQTIYNCGGCGKTVVVNTEPVEKFNG